MDPQVGGARPPSKISRDGTTNWSTCVAVSALLASPSRGVRQRLDLIDTCRRCKVVGFPPCGIQSTSVPTSIPGGSRRQGEAVVIESTHSRHQIDTCHRVKLVGFALGGIKSTCVPVSLQDKGATLRGFEHGPFRKIKRK